jgi:hypothetical protein
MGVFRDGPVGRQMGLDYRGPLGAVRWPSAQETLGSHRRSETVRATDLASVNRSGGFGAQLSARSGGPLE